MVLRMEWVKGTTSGTFQCFFRGNVLRENANILRANTNAIVLRENANYLLKENAKFLGRTQYFCNMLQYGKLALLLFLVNWKVMCYLTSYLKKVIYVTRITCNALPPTLIITNKTLWKKKTKTDTGYILADVLYI